MYAKHKTDRLDETKAETGKHTIHTSKQQITSLNAK